MAEPLTTSVIMSAFAAGAAKKAGELSFSGLFSSISTLVSSSSTTKLSNQFSEALQRYEKQTFDRCIKIKTLINRDTPIDILDIYVPVRFRNSSTVVDQFSLIEKLHDLKTVAISGTGGSGKSMFMKYLWLSLFEDNKGKIPIFLELRNYNDITFEDFLVFLFTSIFSGVENTDGMPIFIKMLHDGKFSFVFDGFDEVSEDRKNNLGKQISAISNKYPSNIFVVSTRPLDTVANWTNFVTYHVAPMTMQDVLLLIKKIDFPNKVKSKFPQAIKTHLFQSHKTFLEIPLLTTIMLFLFNEIADIPNDMHVFYDQAFWTLFRRHDASKEAFDRKLNCGLSLDDFRSAVASFCFFSYIGSKPNLSETDINKYISQSAIFLNLDVDIESFKKDLINNICFLQLDGTDYVFIHRSFQEYFAAVFISNRPENEWLEAALLLPNATTENAVKILHSMNKEKFNSAIIYKIIDTVGIEPKSMSPASLLSRLNELEGNGPQVSILAENLIQTSSRRSIFMYFAMNSRIYRFLVYYVNKCESQTQISYYPTTSLSISKIDKSVAKLINKSLRASKKEQIPSALRYIDIEIYLGTFLSLDEIETTQLIAGKDENTDNALKQFIFESSSYSEFVDILQILCDLMSTHAAERSAKKPFSALIGRAPIFLQH